MKLQVMRLLFVPVTQGIPVHHGLIVDIVHYIIQVAIIIQVGISSAITERWCSKSPGIDHIGEGAIAIITKSIVMDLHLWYLTKGILLAGNAGRLPPESNEVVIRYIFRVTIRNDDIPKTIVIEILEQRRPAPVRFSDTCIKADIRKYGIADGIVFQYTRTEVQL